MFKATLRIAIILIIYQTNLFGQYPTADKYISDYRNLAISEMQRTGIPASIKMGQALLESGAGTSVLAVKANNHFGIKCGNVWNGDSFGRRDDERMLLFFKKKSCFRKYNNAEESYIDHSEFIRRPNGPYHELFNLNKTDYKAWAYGLKKAGYATASDYPEKLIGIIERYHLYQLDGLTAPDVIVSSSDKKAEKPTPIVETSSKDRIIRINQVKAIVAKAGETPTSISRISNESIDNILKYNDYIRFASQTLNQNDIVYLTKKKKSFWGKNKTHLVAQGENMFFISQLYGVRLDKLYKRNHINPEMEPAVGQTIYLRGTRPENNQLVVSSAKKVSAEKQSSNAVLVDKNEKTEANISTEPITTTHQIINERPVTATEPTIKKAGSYNDASSDKLDFVIEPTTNAKPENVNNEDSHEFIPATTGSRDNKLNKPAYTPKEVLEEIKPESSIITTEDTKLIPALTGEKPLTNIMTSSPQKYQTIQNNNLYHIVTGGDTLYNISKRYNITLDKLKSLNQLTDNNIKLGQKLKIK